MNNEEIDTDGTYYPTCPHCGFIDQDDDGYYNDEISEGREQCTECGGWFTWFFEVIPSFWTNKINWVEEWKRYNRTQVQIAELKEIIDNEGR